MDPNIALQLLRTIAYRMESTHSHDQDTSELVALILDLDSWLISGGFLPDSWKAHESILNVPAEVV